MSRARITIFTMGGTIASLGATAAATTVYKIDPARDPVLDAVGGLADLAEIRVVSLAKVSSHDLQLPDVLGLARRIAALRASGGADAVVVTHGTDTMEETAYLLDLLLPPGPAVVMTGAMRPASALSADGPLNLYTAVRLAALPAAAGRGVLVCVNDRIGAARSIAKAHTSAPDAFQAAEQGFAGAVTGDEITFFAPASALPRPCFTLGETDDLPRVEIIYSYIGMDGRALEAALRDGAAGVVIAGTGNGSVAETLKPALLLAREAGVPVVRASRAGAGAVTAADIDAECGAFPAGWLNPQKARLLMMLALREGRSRDEIAALFRTA